LVLVEFEECANPPRCAAVKINPRVTVHFDCPNVVFIGSMPSSCLEGTVENLTIGYQVHLGLSQ
jgi:hypothetical protein